MFFIGSYMTYKKFVKLQPSKNQFQNETIFSFTISCSSVSIFFGANLTLVRSFIINFVYKWEIFITCFFMVNNGSQRINLFTMLASGFGFVVEINLRVIQFITRIIFKSSYFLNVWIIFIFNNSCFRLFIIIINLSCFNLFIKKS